MCRVHTANPQLGKSANGIGGLFASGHRPKALLSQKNGFVFCPFLVH
jgi:hypothetical protein